MNRFIAILFVLAVWIGNSSAAVLVLSPNGTFTTKTSLASAATAADVVGKTVVITSPQIVTTAIAWPADRSLEFKEGGYVTFTGSGTLTGLKEARPEYFGVNTTPGTTDMTTAIQRTINALSTLSGTMILSSQYRVTTTLQIDSPIKIIGNLSQSQTGATARIDYYGTGTCIQIGTDNGHAYDANEYNGIQGVYISDVQIQYSGAATTPLLGYNTRSYGTNTYGIRDWRGGSVILERCDIKFFAYGFWSIQSDFNQFNNCQFYWNKVAIYLGPRSDQFTAIGCVSTWNDTAIEFDSVYSGVLNHWTSNSDGSATTSPFKIYGAYSRSSGHIVFNDCWFENYTGTAGQVVPSFISAGENAGTNNLLKGPVIIKNPIILTNTSATTPRTASLLSFNQSLNHQIYRPVGRSDSYSVTLDYLTVSNAAAGIFPTLNIDIGYQSLPTLCNRVGTASPTIYHNQNDQAQVIDATGNLNWDVSPAVANTLAATVRFFRATNTSGATSIQVYRGDNTATAVHIIDAKGNLKVGADSTGAFDKGHLQIGGYHLWVEAATGKLRIKSSSPTSDSDGVVVGTQ